MSADEPKGRFLARWSRLKQQSARGPATDAQAPTAPPTQPEAPAQQFDPTSLPAIEDLRGDSDFAQFLRQGVPSSLQIQALRKLWVTDPQFREYKPLVEYDWDFNAPDYGKLRITDDVQKFISQVFAEQPAPAPENPDVVAPAPPVAEKAPVPAGIPAGSAVSAATKTNVPGPGRPAVVAIQNGTAAPSPHKRKIR